MVVDVVAGWDKTGSLEQVLEVFKKFDPVLLRLFRKMDPKELKVWQLLDMEKPPTWVNERMALLGDAAHPFTPCMWSAHFSLLCC